MKTADIFYHPNAGDNAGGLANLADPVFFHKSQVRIGTHLECKGRRTPNGKVWIVKSIRTFSIIRGQYRSRKVNEVQKLSDAIELISTDGKRREYLELSFDYLSYSAIWRIAQ
jgi:hypothetical protein